MDFVQSVIFLFLIVLFLSMLKSNIFLLVFGAVIFIYFILQLFSFDPIEILTITMNNILINPLGLVLLIIPLTIDSLIRIIKKFKLKVKIG